MVEDRTNLFYWRVKEWRVTLGIPLAVSTVSSFVPASVRYRTSPSTASAVTLKMILLFYLGKLLVISRNLHADVKIHFRGLQEGVLAFQGENRPLRPAMSSIRLYPRTAAEADLRIFIIISPHAHPWSSAFCPRPGRTGAFILALPAWGGAIP